MHKGDLSIPAFCLSAVFILFGLGVAVGRYRNQPEHPIPRRDGNVGIHRAQPLPEGCVVIKFEQKSLAKGDRCGAVMWALPRMTHHSIESSESSGFGAGDRRLVVKTSPRPPIRGPFGKGTLLNVFDDGRVLDEISVPESFS